MKIEKIGPSFLMRITKFLEAHCNECYIVDDIVDIFKVTRNQVNWYISQGKIPYLKLDKKWVGCKKAIDKLNKHIRRQMNEN